MIKNYVKNDMYVGVPLEVDWSVTMYFLRVGTNVYKMGWGRL